MLKVSRYGVFSGPYFPVFGMTTEKYGPEKNCLFGHFSLRAKAVQKGENCLYYVKVLLSLSAILLFYALALPLQKRRALLFQLN